MMKKLFFILTFVACGFAAKAQPAMDVKQTADPEADYYFLLPANEEAAPNAKAELWIHKANPEKATGQAVVYYPGGSYVAVGNGIPVAKRLAENGITCAWVRYRLPNRGRNLKAPLVDAEAAYNLLKGMADELGFDPAKLGVLGSSAGGHVAGSVATMSSVKPAFTILVYPVLTADKQWRHRESIANLVGPENVDKEEYIEKYSLENRITDETAPTLLIHCDNDDTVPSMNSILYYQKLKEHHVKSSSLRIYPNGGHGWITMDFCHYKEDTFEAIFDFLRDLK